MKKVAMFLFGALILWGCASVGRQIDQSAASKIEKGKTTREEVIQLIGAPDQMTIRGDNSVVFSYHYMRSTIKPATLIPYIGPFVGGANVQNQMTMVVIGPDGIVKDIFSTQGSSEANFGLMTGAKPEASSVEEGKRPK